MGPLGGTHEDAARHPQGGAQRRDRRPRARPGRGDDQLDDHRRAARTPTSSTSPAATRIARGSGMQATDVGRCSPSSSEMQKIMKRMGGIGLEEDRQGPQGQEGQEGRAAAVASRPEGHRGASPSCPTSRRSWRACPTCAAAAAAVGPERPGSRLAAPGPAAPAGSSSFGSGLPVTHHGHRAHRSPPTGHCRRRREKRHRGKAPPHADGQEEAADLPRGRRRVALAPRRPLHRDRGPLRPPA